MPTDVLAHDEQLALGREQPGRVNPAGLVERALLGPKSEGHLGDDLRRELAVVGAQVVASLGFSSSMLALPQTPHDEEVKNDRVAPDPGAATPSASVTSMTL